MSGYPDRADLALGPRSCAVRADRARPAADVASSVRRREGSPKLALHGSACGVMLVTSCQGFCQCAQPCLRRVARPVAACHGAVTKTLRIHKLPTRVRTGPLRESRWRGGPGDASDMYAMLAGPSHRAQHRADRGARSRFPERTRRAHGRDRRGPNRSCWISLGLVLGDRADAGLMPRRGRPGERDRDLRIRPSAAELRQRAG